MHLWGSGAERIYGNLSRKINGNLKFLDSSNGNFAIFSKFIKEVYRIFRGNCANNLGKYGHLHL